MRDSTSGYVGNIYQKCILFFLHQRLFIFSCMVYGEVRKISFHVFIDKCLMSFWLCLLNKEESSLAHIMIAYNLFVSDLGEGGAASLFYFFYQFFNANLGLRTSMNVLICRKNDCARNVINISYLYIYLHSQFHAFLCKVELFNPPQELVGLNR